MNIILESLFFTMERDRMLKDKDVHKEWVFLGQF